MCPTHWRRVRSSELAPGGCRHVRDAVCALFHIAASRRRSSAVIRPRNRRRITSLCTGETSPGLSGLWLVDREHGKRISIMVWESEAHASAAMAKVQDRVARSKHQWPKPATVERQRETD
jgi:hypothetical protein